MSDDWYRNDAWGRRDRDDFEARLARARPGNREQYLRIKGLHLLESRRGARRKAGVELLERLIRDYPDAASEVAGAHYLLAAHHEAAGDVHRAADHYRASTEAERGRNHCHGGPLALASLIAREPSLVSVSEEAEQLLASDVPSIMCDQQFTWALAKARLASRRGASAEAAAYASGALWLFGHDHGVSSRHPDVGLIGEIPRRDYDELVAFAAAGDAEAFTPLVEEYRRADESVEWDWNLVRRMTAGAEATSGESVTGEAPHEPPEGGWLSFDAAARPVLQELRAAGFDDVFDLWAWTGAKLASAAEVRRAAPILVKWLADADNLDVRAAMAMGLRDPRARKLAAVPVLDAFDALDDPEIGTTVSPRTDEIAGQRRLKNALGNAMASLARDEHLDRLEAIIRNPRHGSDRGLAFWALNYCKAPRVVELLIEMVDDPDIGINALHSLKSARSERAEPVLRRLAAQQPLPRKHPSVDRYSEEFLDLERDHHRRDLEIALAKAGLKKLEAARAAGRARP